MEHQDDFLPEKEPFEQESKGFRIAKRCFRILLYGASALVWVLVLYVIISTRESGIFSEMHFGPATRDLAEQYEDRDETLSVYELHSDVFMNYDGSITVGNIFYCGETGELELGIKWNAKLLKYTPEGGEQTVGTISAVLTDEEGRRYGISHTETDSIGRYDYLRICFCGVSLPLGENASGGEDKEGDPEEDALPVFTLSLTLSETGEPLATHYDRELKTDVNDAEFVIFDHETRYKTVDYDD